MPLPPQRVSFISHFFVDFFLNLRHKILNQHVHVYFIHIYALYICKKKKQQQKSYVKIFDAFTFKKNAYMHIFKYIVQNGTDR